MPRTVSQLRVFVASPSDVQAERLRLDKIIRETNAGFLSKSPFRLELVGWETHTHPGFGEDAQSVVNEQIGSDYDIFVGILWSRIGTPTRSAPSGTLEEFYAAYRSWQADPSSITLMLYFKDEPIAPSQLDPDQLRQINDFRNQIPKLGGYYGNFKSTDEFETSMRLHLAQVVQGWRENPTTRDLAASVVPSAPSSVEESEPLSNEDDDQLGYLDYKEFFEEATERFERVVATITAALAEVGTKTEERTAEANTVLATGKPSAVAARMIFDQSAKDLEQFALQLHGEIPQFAQAQEDQLRYLVGATTLQVEMGQVPTDQQEQLFAVIELLNGTITGAYEHITLFQKTLASLPPVSKNFNKAKRRASEATGKLLDILEASVARNEGVRTDLAKLFSRE